VSDVYHITREEVVDIYNTRSIWKQVMVQCIVTFYFCLLCILLTKNFNIWYIVYRW